VLALMRDDKFIGDRDYAVASESPLKVVSGPSESSDAPYFVDLINDDWNARFPTTIFRPIRPHLHHADLNLQRAATRRSPSA